MGTGRSSEPLSRERVEGHLGELPDVELLGVLRRSSNYTFLARLGPEPELLAVYKPAAGESPLWDFESGSLYRREVAAYHLAVALGWPLVPPTVVRADAPHGVGAVQLFVDADPGRHFFEPGPDTPVAVWEEIALFDYLANNADRKSGHCLFDPDGRVWVIDHGLTFHVEPKLRTVIWDFAGRPAAPRLRSDLERALSDAALADRLGELLSKREVAAFRRRAERVLEAAWRFPSPGSGWSVPWPPV